MYYFSACNRSLFKSYCCNILFLPLEKFFNYYGKFFHFYLCIFLKKNFLVNKYKKQMCYEDNKSLFFDAMKHGQTWKNFQVPILNKHANKQ